MQRYTVTVRRGDGTEVQRRTRATDILSAISRIRLTLTDGEVTRAELRYEPKRRPTDV